MGTRNYIGKIPKNKCKYCRGKENLTIDHKIPVALGGTNERKNLQCLCQRCNQMKSKMTDKQIKSLFRWFLQIQEDRVKNNSKPYKYYERK